jgi:hypothetical protein
MKEERRRAGRESRKVTRTGEPAAGGRVKIRILCALLVVAALVGCSTPGDVSSFGAKALPATRSYNGTASVGDFLNITLDTDARTLTYTNLSNGSSGTIPYTVNADGSYALNDPNGNLIAAYEVPDYALLIEAEKAGPNQDTPALITAVESGPISLNTFTNQKLNYMQFRTTAGGLEVGSIAIGASSGQTTSWWPFGAISGGGDPPFHNGTQDFSSVVEAPSGTFMTQTQPASQGGGSDYIFGTANGFFIVDTPNGSILGLPKAASPNFDPSKAGTYNTMFYKKLNASTGANNIETGTGALYQGTLTVTASGTVSLIDSSGNNQLPAGSTLTPVASAGYLYGSAGELQDPCWGIFTVRVTTGVTQQDIFLTFQGNAVLFSSFKANSLQAQGNSTYNYYYGVGMK